MEDLNWHFLTGNACCIILNSIYGEVIQAASIRQCNIGTAFNRLINRIHGFSRVIFLYMVRLIFNWAFQWSWVMRILLNHWGSSTWKLRVILNNHSSIVDLLLRILDAKVILWVSCYQSLRSIGRCLYGLRGSWWRCKTDCPIILCCHYLLEGTRYYLGLCGLANECHWASRLRVQVDNAHGDIKLVNWLTWL